MATRDDLFGYEPIRCTECLRWSKNEEDELSSFELCSRCSGNLCSKCAVTVGFDVACPCCMGLDDDEDD